MRLTDRGGGGGGGVIPGNRIFVIDVKAGVPHRCTDSNSLAMQMGYNIWTPYIHRLYCTLFTFCQKKDNFRCAFVCYFS